MDWWALAGLVLGSVIASGIVGVVGASWAFSRKFENMAGATAQRTADWEKWRTQIETRLNARAEHLAAHERECRERWETQVREQGRMSEQLRSIDEQLKARAERWETLLLEHGGVMERLRSIDQQLQDRRLRR